jgi:hypothetical protein
MIKIHDDILYFSWFRMTSGILSESVLVDLNDPRYFQHGGNLMVSSIMCFLKDENLCSFYLD